MHKQRWNLSPIGKVSDVVWSRGRETYDDSELVEGLYLSVPFPCL